MNTLGVRSQRGIVRSQTGPYLAPAHHSSFSQLDAGHDSTNHDTCNDIMTQS